MSALNQLLAYSSGEWAWRAKNDIRAWATSTVSGDGKILYGVSGNQLFTSYDHGVTWSVINTLVGINRLLSSYDGRILYGFQLINVNSGYRVKISYDYGITWFDTATIDSVINYPRNACCSSNCDILYIATKTKIYKSSNYGTTFSSILTTSDYGDYDTGLYCNETGTDVYAFSNGVNLIRSRDGGVTWSNMNFSSGFSDFSASNDGSIMFGVTSDPSLHYSLKGLYESKDSGQTWSQKYAGTDLPGSGGVVTSKTGKTMAFATSLNADVLGGYIYVHRYIGDNWWEEYTYVYGVTPLTTLSCSFDGGVITTTHGGSGKNPSGSYYLVFSEEE